MPCERSCSVLKDTCVRALMEIMMSWSPGGICLFALWHAEPVLRTCGSFGATMSQMVGAGAQVPHGGPGAAPSQEEGARATGAHGGLGAIPSREVGAGAVGTRDSLGATPSQEAGAVVLT
jgi:hypothetical protein